MLRNCPEVSFHSKKKLNVWHEFWENYDSFEKFRFLEISLSVRALPKPGPELKHANMSVGEYAARKVTGYPLDGNIDEIGGAMVVGEEVVIDGDEMDGDPSEIPMITQFISKVSLIIIQKFCSFLF